MKRQKTIRALLLSAIIFGGMLATANNSYASIYAGAGSRTGGDASQTAADSTSANSIGVSDDAGKYLETFIGEVLSLITG